MRGHRLLQNVLYKGKYNQWNVKSNKGNIEYCMQEENEELSCLVMFCSPSPKQWEAAFAVSISHEEKTKKMWVVEYDPIGSPPYWSDS